MKKQVFEKLWQDLHPNEGRNERNFRLVGWFPIENLPAIAIPTHQAGNSDFVLNSSLSDVGKVLDLKVIQEKLTALDDSDIFVIGNSTVCDHRWGFDAYLRVFDPVGAEFAYTIDNKKGKIDSIHCIIKKTDDHYILFDCSTFGTIMLLRQKRSWWQKLLQNH